ncbi:MAG TPA: cytochrome ubiquinol oxidase subunit I [Geodermatophilus sp.]|nr:cytochrome ubiquinol oxidase subunit I [Geodermatophilus sp.]
MDVLDVARWQFGITTVYHFLMVPLTIGLGLLVAVMHTMWVRTNKPEWLRMTRFWGRIYLINFVLGVATGLVQEFQFGLAWSEYSRFVGDVFGSLLAMEALLAFFLESTFLGLWIFGWGRIPKRLHLAALWAAVIGSVVSAYFIIAANSWMQHPVGVEMDGDTPRLTSIGAVLTNNTALAAFSHAIVAALMVAGALLVGVGLWQLRRRKLANRPATEVDHAVWRRSVRLGGWVSLAAFVLVALTGDWQGKLMYQQQPLKMSSAEALCETEAPASFSLVAWAKLGSNECDDVHSITIPGLLSFLAHSDFSTAVPGVNELQERYGAVYGETYPDDPERFGDRAGQEIDYTPVLAVTYWSFRLMIGMGAVSAGVAAYALWATRRNRVPTSRIGVYGALLAVGAPFAANATGWIFTEMGRQPFVVVPNPDVPVDEQIWFFTAQAVSPGVSAGEVWTSLIALTLVYGVLAVIELGLITRFVRRGVTTGDGTPTPPAIGDGKPADDDRAAGDRIDGDVLSFAY